MQAKVTKILTKNDKGIEAEFSTSIGICRGTWEGEKPVIGNMYAIEIDIPYKLKWGFDITFSEGQSFQMDIIEHEVVFAGKLALVHDNLFSLKLGEGIMLIEAEGVPFDEEMFVKIAAKDIRVYDSNI